MSYSSHFILKHETLVTALQAQYPTNGSPHYDVYGDVYSMKLATVYPAVGLFLGACEANKDTMSYVPITFQYILMVLDGVDIETDYLAKQSSTMDIMEDILDKMDYEILDSVEPVETMIDSETFLGWTVTIVFKAR